MNTTFTSGIIVTWILAIMIGFVTYQVFKDSRYFRNAFLGIFLVLGVIIGPLYVYGSFSGYSISEMYGNDMKYNETRLAEVKAKAIPVFENYGNNTGDINERNETNRTT